MPTNPDWIAEAAKEIVNEFGKCKSGACTPGTFANAAERIIRSHQPSPSVAGEIVSDERAESITRWHVGCPLYTQAVIDDLLRDRAARKAREYARRWHKVSEEKPPMDVRVEYFREADGERSFAHHDFATAITVGGAGKFDLAWQNYNWHMDVIVCGDDLWRPLDPPAASTLGGLEGA